jgi:hypothetical protein
MLLICKDVTSKYSTVLPLPTPRRRLFISFMANTAISQTLCHHTILKDARVQYQSSGSQTKQVDCQVGLDNSLIWQ